MRQNETNNLNKYWFAIYTKPRAEFKAAFFLDDKGIDYYLPTVTRIKRWSDRKKKVTEPVIRSYVFIYATEKERNLALDNSYVVRCVFENGKPAVIPEWQIKNMKRILEISSEVMVKNGLVPGIKVRIISGAFAGVEGIYNGEENDKTLAITIELLNRSIVAKLPAESQLEIIKN